MTRARGVLDGANEEEPFIGWAAAPRADRRFLLAAIPAMVAGAAGAGYGLARSQGDPGAGAWNAGETTTLRGVLAATPYPMLYVADAAAPGGVRTVLLVAEGKCTQSLKLLSEAGRAVAASGHLIQRGSRWMLEVPIALDRWLEESAPSSIGPPSPEPLGRARLSGEIMDSKCFFGVMRPGRGKTHKGCASLCIRGGIPPSFWARRNDGREAVLLMTDAAGGKLMEGILPFVGDPVEAEGELVRLGDIVQFRADAGAYRRVTHA